jgi:dihydroxy-acid dehydratase
MLRACGMNNGDFKKPLIGVANTWIEIGPCNYHLRELAKHVKDGIRDAGAVPLEFNTVSISDGITMGTEGMRGRHYGIGSPEYSRDDFVWRFHRPGPV